MKILFVDDSYSRYQVFINKLFDNIDRDSIVCSIVWVQTAKDAIYYLKTQIFDFIFLDHDLDNENTGINGEGIDIANKMVKMPENFTNSFILIHSMNPIGAQNINKTLQDVKISSNIFPLAYRQFSYEDLLKILFKQQGEECKKV